MAKRRSWESQLFTNITNVNIADITADPDMQHRYAMRDHVITEYMDVLQGGGELAPIKLVRDSDGTLWLWDGFHTLQAAKELGLQTIKAEIERGTKRQAWIKSLGANAKHGIRRSKLDLYKAIDNALEDSEIKFSLLDENGEYSFRSVAKLCAAGHQTISKRWQEEHLPRILAKIDEAVSGGPTDESLKDEAWLDRISEQLGVPRWFTLKRWESECKNLSSQEEEVSRPGTTSRTTTHQVDNTLSPEASDGDLTTGRTTTRQVDNTLSPEASDGDVLTDRSSATTGRTITHQVDNTLSPEASDGDLTTGRTTTHQIDNTLSPEASDGDVLTDRSSATTGRTTTHQVDNTLSPEASDGDVLTDRSSATTGRTTHPSSR